MIVRGERHYMQTIEPAQLGAWTAAIDRNLDLWINNLARTTIIESDGKPSDTPSGPSPTPPPSSSPSRKTTATPSTPCPASNPTVPTEELIPIWSLPDVVTEYLTRSQGDTPGTAKELLTATADSASSLHSPIATRRVVTGAQRPWSIVMTLYDDNVVLGTALRNAFATQDRPAIQSLITADFVWMLPGDNAMSGDVTGLDGVFDRFAALASYGVDINIEHVVVNQHGPAFILHNTGSHGGQVLDEYLVTVITVRDGRAARLETFLSDIPMMNAYFI